VHLTVELTVCVSRGSDNRVKVENSDETVHTSSRTTSELGNPARILTIARSFPDFSETMKYVGNSAESEVKAIIEANLQFDATIKTKFA